MMKSTERRLNGRQAEDTAGWQPAGYGTLLLRECGVSTGIIYRNEWGILLCEDNLL